MILQLIYLLSSLLVLLTITARKNPISPLSLFGLGTIIYGFPLFLGYTTFATAYQNRGADVSTYFSSLDWRVYIIFLFLQLLFFAIAIFFPERSPQKILTENPLILIAINLDLVISMILFLKNLGWKNLWLSKLERIQYISSWYSFAAIFAVLAVLYWCFYKSKQILHLIPAISFLILDIFMGYRTTLILGLMSVCLALFWHTNIKFDLAKRLKLFVFSGIAVLVGFIYKPIYYSLEQKIFQVNYIVSKIMENSFLGSEPFVIMGVLNEIINQKIIVDNNYILESFIQYIPLYETITGNTRISFNFYIQNTLFPEVKWGLASTSLGELYAIGGFAAISLWWTFVFFFLRFYPKKNSYYLILYFYLAPYILFYFYRNDWHFMIGVTRLLIFSCVGIFYTYMGLKLGEKILNLRIKRT